MSGLTIRPQSTSFTFPAGPFLDATDAKTRKTALTIAQAARLISKAGASFAQSHVTGNLTHDAAGYYTMTLDTTDTDTLGALDIDIDIATALVYKREFLIVAPDAYNALMGSGNGLLANLSAINGVTAAAVNLALSTGAMAALTVDNTSFTATATELETSTIATAATGHYIGRALIFTSGTLIKQAVRITNYVLTGGRGHFTYSTATSAPANGVTALIV